MFDFSENDRHEDVGYSDLLEFYEKRTGVAVDFMKVRMSEIEGVGGLKYVFK